MESPFQNEHDLLVIGNCLAVLKSFAAGLKPTEDMNLWEWADSYRFLPSESSDDAGPWSTNRVPYMREVMYEMSPASPAPIVCFMKGSQIGYTEVLINLLLYHVHKKPKSCLHVQPTIEMGRRFSKQRLGPSVRDMPIVRMLMEAGTKTKNSGDTILQKDYKGGTIIVGGANSAASLSSMPMPIVECDEVDRWPDDVDGEGDPLWLLIRRTTNFRSRKVIIGGTPTIKDMSRIEFWFENSDQRYYYIPCPACGEYQKIDWDNICWDEGKPETASLKCVSCKYKIEEYNKTWMLENGEWRRENPDSNDVGFHLSALYSPLGWYSWAQAVDDYLKSHSDTNKRKVWINTVKGETYEETESAIDGHWLTTRLEKYNAPVPRSAFILTAGVDTQTDRLECTVVGWGVDWESWVIEHRVFYGDTKQKAVYNDLDVYLQTQFQHENGDFMNIACIFQDAMGTATDEVYEFCKLRSWRRVYACQGVHGPGRPTIATAKKSSKRGQYIFRIGVDGAKEGLYKRLLLAEHGPGYVHLPDTVNEDYCKQLVSEKKEKRKVSGRHVFIWTLDKGKRNEALDCYVYAYAACKLLNPNFKQLAETGTVINADFTKARKKRRTIISEGVKV